MSTLMQSSVATCTWQVGFLSLLPRIETHAKLKFRRLPAEQREEAIQEAIASACASYQLLAARGRLAEAYASTLAGYAVRFVRNGRHVGGHQNGAKDPLSPVAQKRHGVTVVSFQRRAWGRSEAWKQLAMESRQASVSDLAAFRIDFADWLGTLTHRDRRIIGALVAGERTSEVAERFKVSPGRISQLRRQYERQWQIFQGETGCGRAA